VPHGRPPFCQPFGIVRRDLSMTSKVGSRRRLIVALLALLFVVVGCGGGRPKAAPLPTRPTTVHSVSSPTTSTMTTSATTIPITTAPCRNSQLAITIQASYMGMGSAAEELGFLNVSNSVCTLDGYPGVAALNDHGQQITQARRDAYGGPPTDVKLNPGQLAEALIQGSDEPSGTCKYFTRSFLVTAPNLTQSMQVTAMTVSSAIGVLGCSFWVYPVRPETLQPTSSG
jgi:hypothetical protein